MSLIQIKRSQTDAYPANVVFGELAYTTNGNILYIGDDNDIAIPIAGKRTPGVLTANQAIVVNSSSFVNILNAANLNITDTATINNFTVTLISGNTANVSSVTSTDVIVLETLTVNTVIETSDAPLNRKMDILWKKIGFNKTSTDLITNKLANSETITSNNIIAPTEIWTKAGSIPSTKPASNSGVVTVYTDLECEEDTTSTDYRTWKTNVINWIPPRFGSSYQISVYMDSANSSNPSINGTALSSITANTEWYFDYQSGVVHFMGVSLPAGLDETKSIYVSGAKYSGNVGFTGMTLTSSELVNATITSLSAPLEVKDGGTGVSSFTSNSLLAAANSSTLSFKTGSNGQVMLVTDNNVDFSDLDGGTY